MKRIAWLLVIGALVSIRSIALETLRTTSAQPYVAPPVYLPLVLRQPIPSPTPSPAFHRVVFQGDSFTGGLYASTEEQTWRYKMSQFLMAYRGSEQIEQIDAVGVKMTGAPDVARAEVARFNPDLVFIAYGINDVSSDESVEEFEAATRAVFDAYRGRTVQVAGVAWCNWKAGDAFDRALLFNDTLAHNAARYGYSFVDLFRETVGHSEYLSDPNTPSIYPPAYHGDYFHYNDLGHEAIYRAHLARLPEPRNATQHEQLSK